MLTGSVIGSSRAYLMKRAVEIAVEYYGTSCVVVELREEGAETVVRMINDRVVRVVFSCDFIAEIHHDLDAKAYGPDKCRGCDQESWPHDRLPQRAPIAEGGTQ